MSHTRAAIEAQPEWLLSVQADLRLPPGRAVFTGCGTSWHAAQTGGDAVEALEAVLRPPEADVLVAVSHEGETLLTREAVEAFPGETWLVTGSPESPLAARCDRVVVCTPRLETSLCHTASYVCAVAQLAALRGEDVSGLPARVAAALEAPRFAVSKHERWLVAGAGRDWPTGQEAVLKLREGAHVAAEAHRTEELLHGHLAAVDASVRCFVLEGEGRAAERARGAVAALRALGCDVELVPTEHPAVDVVAFQLLAVDLAEARGIDPDPIRRDEEPWARARRAYD
ncbi:MAG TPA: SIS domain-containing protein [Gaiellaceae bacterium]|nr:SIS domain-containing protein [Gaiellaceae bacterium]